MLLFDPQSIHFCDRGVWFDTQEGNQENPGVVPRTIQELFKQASNNNNNTTSLFTFSMLEIYVGNLKDLLVPQPTKPTDPMPPWLVFDSNSIFMLQVLCSVSEV